MFSSDTSISMGFSQIDAATQCTHIMLLKLELTPQMYQITILINIPKSHFI